MTRTEAAACLGTLVDLFPLSELTDRELDLFARRLLPFEKADAVEAIEETRVRSRFNRPSFDGIFSLLRASATRQQRTGPSEGASQVDVIRAQQQGRADRMDGFEVLLRFHRQAWVFQARRRDSYRETIRRRCVADLIAAGMVAGDGLSPGDYAFAQRCGEVPFLPPAEFDLAVDDIVENAPRFVTEQDREPAANAA